MVWNPVEDFDVVFNRKKKVVKDALEKAVENGSRDLDILKGVSKQHPHLQDLAKVEETPSEKPVTLEDKLNGVKPEFSSEVQSIFRKSKSDVEVNLPMTLENIQRSFRLMKSTRQYLRELVFLTKCKEFSVEWVYPELAKKLHTSDSSLYKHNCLLHKKYGILRQIGRSGVTRAGEYDWNSDYFVYVGCEKLFPQLLSGGRTPPMQQSFVGLDEKTKRVLAEMGGQAVALGKEIQDIDNEYDLPTSQLISLIQSSLAEKKLYDFMEYSVKRMDRDSRKAYRWIGLVDLLNKQIDVYQRLVGLKTGEEVEEKEEEFEEEAEAVEQ